MDLIKTGRGIKTTVSNIGRLKEILSIFAKNGLSELVIKSGIQEKIPGFVLPKSAVEELHIENMEEKNLWQIFGKRIRISFEELGPCFIKLGQLLSTREDIFPSDFVDELKLLLDKVKPGPFFEMKKVVESNLGGKIEEFFSFIDEHPIGVASIGQVYRGQLKTGELVVIKVRRPDILKKIKTDISILSILAQGLEKLGQEMKYLAPTRLIDDFSNNINRELDFFIEAMNAERLSRVISEIDNEKIFFIPKIFQKYTTNEILVMEFVEGISFADKRNLNNLKNEIEKKLALGVNVFISSLLQHGTFHADLHGGNLFLMPDGRIGVIDFGLIGTLGKKGRINLLTLLYSLVNSDFENLVYEFLDVAEYEIIPDIEFLTRDLKECLSPFIGLTVQQTNLSLLLNSLVRTMGRHQIFLPRDWFIVFRALMTLDGLGKSLGIDFDIYSLIETNIKQTIKKVLSKDEITQEAMWLSRDLLSSLRLLPRHFRWFIRDFSKKKYRLDIKISNVEKHLFHLVNSVYFFSYYFFASIFLIIGAFFLMRQQLNPQSLSDIPLITWVFWFISFVQYFLAHKKYRSGKKS